MSVVVVLDVLWRMAVDISNTALSLVLKVDWLIDNGVYEMSQLGLLLRLLMDH